MTLKQIEKHLWINISSPKKKLNKVSTYNIDMSEEFKYEMNHNIKHANSKEEGSKNQKVNYLHRSINLIS